MIDLILMICGVCFGVGLVPQVIRNHKNKRCDMAWVTIVLTGGPLWVMVGAYLHMGWYLSAVSTSICALCWTAFGVQRVVYTRYSRFVAYAERVGKKLRGGK